MKVGQETICYQHHQAQTLLENLLKSTICKDYEFSDRLKKNLLEAIDWIEKANDSAVRMENKLVEYKQFKDSLKMDIY